MPLTRHLYREDEVVAAVMLSIFKGRREEAIFWALELLDSGMVNALLDCGRTIWFYGFGVKTLWWIRAWEMLFAAEEIDGSCVLRLVNALAIAAGCNRKDGTMLALLGVATHPAPIQSQALRLVPPSRTAPLESLWPHDFKEGLNPLENYVAGACQQRKLVAAWRAWNGTARRPELLEAVLRWRHGEAGVAILSSFVGGGQQEAAIALATAALSPEDFAASLSASVADRQIPPLPEDLQQRLEEWSAATGRPRARRAFVIPWDCLWHITERGAHLTVYDSNEKELLGSLEKPGALWGSEFWDDVAEEFGGWEAVRNDPAARESFYATYFPEDIPDEWSAADRAKSHGRGALQKGQQTSAAAWLKRWFGGLDSVLIWKGVEVACGVANLCDWDTAAAASPTEDLVVPPPVAAKKVAVLVPPST
jgi:hypothetical protein